MMFEGFERLPDDAREALLNAERRIGGRHGAELFWNRALTREEQKRLGKDYLTAYQENGGTVQMWQSLRGGTRQRAVIEVALAVNLLSQSSYLRLLREIGDADSAAASPIHLQWDKTIGELRLNGEVIRRVRLTLAENLICILDAFQECGWPRHMDCPLSPSTDEGRLRESLKSLNKGLKRIRFYADGTGEGLYWEPR